MNNILIVDDDKIFLKGIERRYGDKFNIFTVSSGRDAIELISNGTIFSVVLSDYHMPHMNGVQLFNEIDKIDSSIIKVLITGYADLNIAQPEGQAG